MENNNKKNTTSIILLSIYTMVILVAILFGLYTYKSQHSFYIEVNEISMVLGESYQIQIIPEKSKEVNYKEYTYKSKNSNVAIINKEGYIIPNGVGTTKIEITSKKGFSKEKIIVNILEKEIETITFNGNITLKKYETAKCYPIINDNSSIMANLAYRSENEDIVVVDEDGKIKALAHGTTKVYATAQNGVTGSVEVIVERDTIEATQVSIEPTKVTLNIGDSKTLKVTIFPEDTTNKSLNYISSNPSIVSVDQSGKIKAKKEGEATIIVKTTNGLNATSKIIVKEDKKTETTKPEENKNNEIIKVSLNSSLINLKQGKTYELKATITPNNATNKTVAWTSSDTSIATVNNGIVTAKKAGTVTITAKTSTGNTATCKVIVEKENIEVANVELSQTATTLDIGNSVTLTAIILPENATDKTVTWTSSNSNIVTVSGNGTMTAKKTGTATITVKTTNGKTKSCKVTVPEKSILAEKITLNKSQTTIDINKTETLTATISPSDTTNKNIIWITSDKNIATVSNGTITAKKVGTITITAKTSNGKTATCKVTVKDPNVYATSISLNKTSFSIEVGKTYSFTATISPSNTTNKTVTWTSSDTSVITVNNKGQITTIKAGTATITAKTSNGKKATCKVTVKNPTIYATSISLNKTSLSIYVGKTSTLTATIFPSNTTNKTVAWTSSDTTIATVSNGVVTAKKEGTVTITAKSSNGKTATCKVTVKKDTFTNPLTRAADPWVTQKDGYYYFTATTGKNIKIYKTKNLHEIGIESNAKTVYTSELYIWAPEIHYIEGRWYIYFTIPDTSKGTDDGSRRMYVLRSKTQDAQGEYEFMGKIYDSTDMYAIDGTVLQWNGQLYFVWSGLQNIGGGQNLYIAHMSNPYTIDSERVLLSAANYYWEKYGWDINEGPQVLIKNNTLHIIYSASSAGTEHYSLGMLTYNGNNILSSSSWTKKSEPVFKSGNGIYGPGHASFVKSPDGTEDWIVYHGYNGRADLSDWSLRRVFIQKFTWNGNTPVFGSPIASNTEIKLPSGTK